MTTFLSKPQWLGIGAIAAIISVVVAIVLGFRISETPTDVAEKKHPIGGLEDTPRVPLAPPSVPIAKEAVVQPTPQVITIKPQKPPLIVPAFVEVPFSNITISRDSGNGSVRTIDHANDLFDGVWRNSRALTWENFSGGSDAWIEFALNKKYRSMKMTIVIPKQEYNSNSYIEISGDKKVIFRSKVLNQQERPFDVEIDVVGQDFIRISKKSGNGRSMLGVLLANGCFVKEE